MKGKKHKIDVHAKHAKAARAPRVDPMAHASHGAQNKAHDLPPDMFGHETEEYGHGGEGMEGANEETC